MSQTLTQRPCDNKKYRMCALEDNYPQCKNCGYVFSDKVQKGTEILGECESCDKKGVIVVESIGITYQKEKVYCGRCHTCIKIWSDIGELYEKFVGEWVFVDHDENTGQTHVKSNEDSSKRLDQLVADVSNLPKAELRQFLRSVFRSVER